MNKSSAYLFVCLLFSFCFCLHAVASDGNYKGQLTVKVASGQTGRGLVYVDDKDAGTEVTSDAKVRDNDGRKVTFEIVAEPNPGYSFDAWRKGDSPDSDKVSESATYTYTDRVPDNSNLEVTLYAFFNVENYFITYDYGYEGEPSITDIYTIEYDSYTFRTPVTREHFRFDGWKLSEDTSEESVGGWNHNDTYTNSINPKNGYYGHVKLIAQWTETTPGNLSITVSDLESNDSVLCSIFSSSDRNTKLYDVAVRKDIPVELNIDPGDYIVVPNSRWSLNYSFIEHEYHVTVRSAQPASVEIQVNTNARKKRIGESYNKYPN